MKKMKMMRMNKLKKEMRKMKMMRINKLKKWMRKMKMMRMKKKIHPSKKMYKMPFIWVSWMISKKSKNTESDNQN